MAKNAFVWKWWPTHVTVDGNSAVPDGWRSSLNIEVRNNQKEKGLDARIQQSQQVSIARLAILRRTIHFFITCAWTLLVSFRDTTNFGHFIVLSSALDPPQLSVSQIF